MLAAAWNCGSTKFAHEKQGPEIVKALLPDAAPRARRSIQRHPPGGCGCRRVGGRPGVLRNRASRTMRCPRISRTLTLFVSVGTLGRQAPADRFACLRGPFA